MIKLLIIKNRDKITYKTPKAVAAELGQKLKIARLNANLSQEQVAESAWISRKTVAKAEEGYVLLENLVAILTALDILGQIDLFIPQQHYSPIQMLKLQGKKWQRATRASFKSDKKDLDW